MPYGLLPVMILNFGVNALLLLGVEQLASPGVSPGRLLAAALTGAVYSGICLLPDARFLGGFFWRIVSLCLIPAIAFGIREWKEWGIFALLNLALEGAALSAGHGGPLPLALCAVALWALCQWVLGSGSPLVPVRILSDAGAVELTALRDTGNTLRDPVSGEQVLVIGAEPARKLTGLTDAQLRDPLRALGCRPGLRLIPYRAVGQDSGMLLAMRFPQVTVGRSTRSMVVAFAPQGLEGQPYQALTGGNL